MSDQGWDLPLVKRTHTDLLFAGRAFMPDALHHVAKSIATEGSPLSGRLKPLPTTKRQRTKRQRNLRPESASVVGRAFMPDALHHVAKSIATEGSPLSGRLKPLPTTKRKASRLKPLPTTKRLRIQRQRMPRRFAAQTSKQDENLRPRVRRGDSTNGQAAEVRNLDITYQKNCKRVSKIFGSSLRLPPNAELNLELLTAT